MLCFPLALSLGDIREPFSQKRQTFLQSLVCVQGTELENVVKEQLTTARDGLETLLKRAGRGEAVRIWYSHHPDELCGIHWLMTLLDDSMDIRAVELPRSEELRGSIVQYSGWGDIGPGEWHRFAPLEKTISPMRRRMMANRWRQLCEENAPLRAELNGRLQSCSIEIYDYYIDQELEAAGEEFREAVVIGNVLGKYGLGIGDWFVHARIEERIARGELLPVTQSRKGSPVYHRILRKTAP